MARAHVLRSLVVLTSAFLLSFSALVTAQPTENTIVRSTQIAGIPPLSFDLEAQSSQRYALVVGNGEYANVTDLPNAVNDARDMADLLREGGYVVADYYNVTKLDFEAALRRMLFEVEPGAELFFYYAGHGVQIGAQNYLLPSDTNVSSVYDVPFSTVSLSSLMSLASARARSLVAVLDACRDNPFPDQQGVVYLDGTPAQLKTGFTAQDTPINSLVVFSTSPGAVALDGTGDNSPFTTALLKSAKETPETPFNEMLKQIRRDVYAWTGRRQVPWESSSLVEPVYLSRDTPLFNTKAEPTNEGHPTIPLTIETVLDRSVDIGTDLSAVSSATDVSVLSRPKSGRLAVADGVQSAVLPLGDQTNVPLGNQLVYRPRAQQVRALSMVTQDRAPDQFQIRVGDNVHDVQMNLSVDPCDFQAGDHLDPDGVGITRFPNELEPNAALAACTQAIVRDPENGRFHYQLGRAYLALRDVDAAATAFKQASDLGHTRAIHAQGTALVARYAETAGTRSGRAPDEVLALYARGVELGDPYAYHSLGLQYLRHPQTADEPRQGYALLSRSLELGHTFSMNALGLYFLEEGSDHYDAARGLRYLRESAARDDIYGFQNMGFVYLNGIGDTPKDLELAYELFLKASDGGHPTAPSSLGRMYNAGTAPGGRNPVEAIKWYDIGLSRGDGWGGANGAWIIANRNPVGFTVFDAAVRAAKAASLRDPGPKAEALSLLNSLSSKAIDGGIQKLMLELGQDVVVDGAFGAQSEQALTELGTKTGRIFSSDRIERITALSTIFWERSTFRVDLY
ncbi:MAG: caspase family protein [Litoreibacter sp.]